MTEDKQMTSDNLAQILSHIDQKFEDQEKLWRQYIATQDVKIESVQRDVAEIKEHKEADHLKVAQTVINQLQPTIDMTLTIIKEVRSDSEKSIATIEAKIDTHDEEINSLKAAEGERAKSLLEKIKDNALQWAIPSFLILIVWALSSGQLIKLVGG